MANTAHGDLFGGDSDDFFRDDIRRHHVEGAEEVSIVPRVRLLDVVSKDLFLLGIALEVFFEGAVADELLFEFKHFLCLHCLVRQVVEDRLDARLRLGDLGPNHGQALQHIVSVEILAELALNEPKHGDIIVIFGCRQTQNAAALFCDLDATLLVRVVVSGHIEVDHIRDFFDERTLGVASLEHHDNVELSNVEEVKNGADLCLWHVGAEDEGPQAELGEEVLHAVGLRHILHHDDCLALEDRKLQHIEHNNVLVKDCLGESEEVDDTLKCGLVATFILVVHLDDQSFLSAHQGRLNLLEIVLLIHTHVFLLSHIRGEDHLAVNLFFLIS